jgi:hypothetical protein
MRAHYDQALGVLTAGTVALGSNGYDTAALELAEHAVQLLQQKVRTETLSELRHEKKLPLFSHGSRRPPSIRDILLTKFDQMTCVKGVCVCDAPPGKPLNPPGYNSNALRPMHTPSPKSRHTTHSLVSRAARESPWTIHSSVISRRWTTRSMWVARVGGLSSSRYRAYRSL